MDWGLVAAISGGAAAFVGGIVADVLRSRLNIGEARAEREASRTAFKEDRRVAFELETLLALQTAVQNMARQTGKRHHLDELLFRESGEWGTSELPDEVGGEESLVVGREFVRLQSRVFDDDLQALLDAFNRTLSDHALTFMLPGSTELEKRARAESLLDVMGEQFEAIQQQIGRRLRALHTE